MLLPLFASVLLVGNPSPAPAEPRPLTYEFKPLREEETGYRPLERRSILYGPTEFRVSAPEPREVVAITVVGEGLDTFTGRAQALCRSSASPNVCRVDFGEVIARRRFRIDAEVRPRRRDARSSLRAIRHPRYPSERPRPPVRAECSRGANRDGSAAP